MAHKNLIYCAFCYIDMGFCILGDAKPSVCLACDKILKSDQKGKVAQLNALHQYKR